MGKLNAFILCACVVLVAGCSRQKPSIEPVAYAQALADGTYEVGLRRSLFVRGGPCNFSLCSTRVYETNWLYVPALDGAYGPDQIVLKVGDKNDVGDYTYAIKGLRGTVWFSNDTMTVALEQPHYDDEHDVYHGYAPC